MILDFISKQQNAGSKTEKKKQKERQKPKTLNISEYNCRNNWKKHNIRPQLSRGKKAENWNLIPIKR